MLGLSVAAFALAMVLVWRDWGDDGGEAVWKALAIAASLAGAASQTAMTTSRRRLDDARAVELLYLAAIVCAAGFAGMVTVAALAEVSDENYYRALGALTVADLLFVALQSVVRRLTAPAAQARPAAVEQRFVVVVDRPAAGLPAGYATTDDARTIECRAVAPDFAGAVADAVRELEGRGLRVERIERGGRAGGHPPAFLE